MSFNFQQLRASLKRVLIVTLTTVLILCQFDMSALAVTRVDKNGDIVYSNVTGNISGDVSGNPSPGDVSGNARALKRNISVAIGESFKLRLTDQEYWVYSDDGEYTVEKDLSRFETRYEWYKENEDGELVELPNSNSDTYSVESFRAEDEGRYIARMYGTVSGKEIKFAERSFNVSCIAIGNIPDEADFEFGVKRDFKPTYHDGEKNNPDAQFEITYARGFEVSKYEFGSEGTTLIRTGRKTGWLQIDVYLYGECVSSYDLDFRFPDYKEYNFGEIRTRAFTDGGFHQDFSIPHQATVNQTIEYQVALYDECTEDEPEVSSDYYTLDKKNGILSITKENLKKLDDRIESLCITYSVSINGYIVKRAYKWLDIMNPMVIPAGEADAPDPFHLLTGKNQPGEFIAIDTTGLVYNSENPYGLETTLHLQSIASDNPNVVKVEQYDKYSYALYGLKKGNASVTRVYQYGSNGKTVTDITEIPVHDAFVYVNPPENLSLIVGQTKRIAVNPKIWTTQGLMSPAEYGGKVKIEAKPYFYSWDYGSHELIEEFAGHRIDEFVEIDDSLNIIAKKPIYFLDEYDYDEYNVKIVFTATIDGVEADTMLDDLPVYIRGSGIVHEEDGTIYDEYSIAIDKDEPATISPNLKYLRYGEEGLLDVEINFNPRRDVECIDEDYNYVKPDIDVVLLDNGDLQISTNARYKEDRILRREIWIYCTLNNDYESEEEYCYCYNVTVNQDSNDNTSNLIDDCTIDGIADKDYTGKPVYQNFTVTNANGELLVNKWDYITTYDNNLNSGVATVTIKGIGYYQGTITKTFNIIGNGSSGGGSSGGDIGGGSSGGDIGAGGGGSAGGGGGGGAAPSEPEDSNITNSGSESGGDASTNVDVKDNTTVADGKAETKVDADLGSKIVENAVENKSTDVVIKAETEKGDSSASTVALPASTMKDISDKTDASVTIKTDSAEVSLDKAAVDAVAAQAGTSGDVKLVVETKENNKNKVEIELKLETSNGAVTDFKGGNVTVTVPVSYELAGKKIVCVYIDENGKYTKMEGKLASDGKSYTFTTGHFSTYAILEEAEADAIIAEQNKPAEEAAPIKVGSPAVKLYAYKGGKLRVKASAKNATGYKVYYKKSTWKKYKTYTKGNVKTLDKTFKKLAKGKYTVKVKAYSKAADGKLTLGAASKAKTITVKK